MTNSASKKFCLVGAGRIAQTHLEALAKIDNAELVAVVEPREAAGRSVAEQCGCTYHEDYRDAAITEAADAVIICTPPNLHATVATHFLQAGLHVLCEKPLTLNVADAVALTELAQEQQRVLMMASKFRYVGDVIAAKSLIETGILGQIVSYENSFCGRVAMEQRWNSDREISGGGVIIDNGCHSVDIVRYLLGPIAEIQAVAGPRVQPLEVEDTARVLIRAANGALGIIDLSWSTNKAIPSYIAVYGTEGALEVGWQGSRYRQEGSPDWVSFGSGYGKVAAFRGQLDNFINTIHKTEVPRITPTDALASVRVIERAYASIKSCGWQTVEGGA